MGNDGWREEESILKLNPELVKQRQNTYSSLTDLGGIAIFSDEFAKKLKEIESNDKKKEQELKGSVFIEKSEKINEGNDWLRAQLFMEQEELILTQEYNNKESKLSFIDIGIITMAMLAVAALYLFIFNNKKTWRKKR